MACHSYLLPDGLPEQRKSNFRPVAIKDMRSGRINFDAEVVVVSRHQRHPYLKKARTSRNRIVPNDHVILYVFHVADATGSIVLNMFQPMGQEINRGHVLRIRGAYSRIWDECESLCLYAGPKAGIEILPWNGVMPFNGLPCQKQPNFSLFTWRTDPKNPRQLIGIPPPCIDLHWHPKSNCNVIGFKVRPGETQKPAAVPNYAEPKESDVPRRDLAYVQNLVQHLARDYYNGDRSPVLDQIKQALIEEGKGMTATIEDFAIKLEKMQLDKSLDNILRLLDD